MREADFLRSYVYGNVSANLLLPHPSAVADLGVELWDESFSLRTLKTLLHYLPHLMLLVRNLLPV